MTKGWKALVLSVSLFCGTHVVAGTSFSDRKLSENVSVVGSITETDFAQLLKKGGFQSVIVHRPDQEAGNLVTANDLRNIAEKSHISLIYQPVQSGKISATDVTEFSKYYNNLPKPVLLVCRTGSRSEALYQQAKKQGLLHE